MKFQIKLSLVASSLSVLSFLAVGCSSTKNTKQPSPNEEHNAAAQAQPVATQNPKPTLSLPTIYFDFDKYVIPANQMEAANSLAKTLKSDPALKIQIQGNTDDRGSVEYNMALGNKRADSLKKYLVTQGADENNISTVSYGKERPAVQGDDENAWSKNRRDDVVEQK